VGKKINETAEHDYKMHDSQTGLVRVHKPKIQASVTDPTLKM
jgi:hypothetical protein